MHKHVLPVLLAVGLAACSPETASEADTPPPQQDLNAVAKDYLVLELSMVPHDANHVDAYFGPEDLRLKAEQLQLDLNAIGEQAETMQEMLSTWPHDPDDALLGVRIKGLQGRLNALLTRVAMNQGETFSFDEESRRLFNATAPDHDAGYFADIIEQIDALLPGDGTTSDRVNEFSDRFEIPKDKLASVFDAAIQECRRRTRANIRLTENETFTTEFVTDKPWSGYNWYQGNSISLIQVNTDLPIKIDRAIDLGCHEGYPGHHTLNLLMEKNLVADKGWLEYSLYPLFSPSSLIAEGSGNYGIRLAFPGDERIQFEKEVLFPLAGLSTDDAERYYELLDLTSKLSYAGNEAARDYLDGKIDTQQLSIGWCNTLCRHPSGRGNALRFSIPIAVTSSTTIWARTWLPITLNEARRITRNAGGDSPKCCHHPCCRRTSATRHRSVVLSGAEFVAALAGQWHRYRLARRRG